MTKRQTAIALIALALIVACIVVAWLWPPVGCGISVWCSYYRSATIRDAAYFAAGGVAVVAIVLALSPWGRR